MARDARFAASSIQLDAGLIRFAAGCSVPAHDNPLGLGDFKKLVSAFMLKTVYGELSSEALVYLYG